MGLQPHIALQKLTRLLGCSRRINISHSIRSATRGRLQKAIAVDCAAFRNQRQSTAPIENRDLWIERMSYLVRELPHENLAVAIENAAAREQVGGESGNAPCLYRKGLHSFWMPRRDDHCGVVASNTNRAHR
ncbi:hypothetical protein D9M71_289810 [compost metagenome]